MYSRSQTKDHSHWSGSMTSAHVKSRVVSWVRVYGWHGLF